MGDIPDVRASSRCPKRVPFNLINPAAYPEPRKLADELRNGHLGGQPFASLAPLRRKAAVCVVCSRYENLPLAVLETMALGCPLVAARVGGIPEVIDGHANGLLHCAGSSDDLAAQIISLLNETASRWENTNYSASPRRTCFALASRHQSLVQTAPLTRATNLRIKANPVPFSAASFKSLYPKGRNGLR